MAVEQWTASTASIGEDCVNLRIYRTFSWEVHNPQGRCGGELDYRLEETDTLQFEHEGQWVDVPIVEAKKPPHPGDARREQRLAEMQEGFREQMKNIKFNNARKND